MKVIIVIPAYNEERILKRSILKTFNFCRARFRYLPAMLHNAKQAGTKALQAGRKSFKITWQIIIADNNSTDQTAKLGQTLATEFQEVEYLFIEKKGKGAAIKAAWEKYAADIYCFMDADLATDLSALPELVRRIEQGNDLVVGSRFHPDSKYHRSLLRKLTSLGYRIVLKLFLGVKINDAPCGFKAINNKVKEVILPQVQNNQWFFDSELVILAEKKGYKIKEIPVTWQDPRERGDKSRVKTISLSWAYFKQVLSLRKRLGS